MSAVLRKRRCRFCRRSFLPYARQRERQYACSSPECQKRRQAANQAAWLKREPGYFRKRGGKHRAYARRTLTLKATATEVTVYAAHEEIARHARDIGRGHDIVDKAHVKALLDTKHRGTRGALLHRFTALGDAAATYLKGLTLAEISLYRHVKKILHLVDRFGREEVVAAIAHAEGFRAFGADYVERIVIERRRRRNAPEPLGPLSLPRNPELEGITLEEIDLSHYDRALGTEETHAEPREDRGTPEAKPPLPPVDPHPRDLPEGPRDGGEGEGLPPRDP